MAHPDRIRPVPGARLAQSLVTDHQPFGKSLATLSKTLSKAKAVTADMHFDRQLIHNVGLTVFGAFVLLTYQHLATHFGLPNAPEVFLAAGLSGSGPEISYNEKGEAFRTTRPPTGSVIVAKVRDPGHDKK
ncbi:hypothetical protein M1328_04860 [Patescibacteria group bacterium]|nr:hypothetical protein [Patescibacteria group bacterium]